MKKNNGFEKKINKLFYSLLKVFFSPFFKFFWIKNVVGVENIPIKGGCIIVANHSSYFDFFSLISVSKRKIFFLAAEKFFKGKIWGILVRGTSQIMVDRTNKDKSASINQAKNALDKGEILGIFPEGTRSPDGEIHRVYTGAARLALDAKVSIIPVGIKGAYDILPRGKRFPKIKKQIEIRIGSPMNFENYYKEKNDNVLLEKITKEIIDEIKRLLQ